MIAIDGKEFRDFIKELIENDKEIRKAIKDVADRVVIRGDDYD